VLINVNTLIFIKLSKSRMIFQAMAITEQLKIMPIKKVKIINKKVSNSLKYIK